IPSRFWPVSARIRVRPAAARTSRPAMTSGRPALSRNTRASSTSGSTWWRDAGCSINGRQRSVRAAVASTPPGLLAYTTWLKPAVARAANSSSRAGAKPNGSVAPGLSESGPSLGASSPPLRSAIATAAAASAATATMPRRRVLGPAARMAGTVAYVGHLAIGLQEVGLLLTGQQRAPRVLVRVLADPVRHVGRGRRRDPAARLVRPAWGRAQRTDVPVHERRPAPGEGQRL